MSTNFQLSSLVEILDRHKLEEEEVPTPQAEHTPSSDDTQEEQMCKEHNQLSQFYCRVCNVLVCNSCTSDRHKGHVIMSLAESKQHFVIEMKKLLNDVKLKERRIEECLRETVKQKEFDNKRIQVCKEEMMHYFDQSSDKIKSKISFYQEKLIQITEHHSVLLNKLDDIQCQHNKVTESNSDILTSTRSEIITVTNKAEKLLNKIDEDITADSNINSISTTVQELKSVAESEWDFAQSDYSDWSFCQQHDPLKADIIDENGIVIEGLVKGHIGSNIFNVTYSNPLSCTQNILHVDVVLPNGNKCKQDEIKIEYIETNKWRVSFYVSATLNFIFFSRQQFITVSIKLGGVSAKGSPFKIPCDISTNIFVKS